MADPFRYSVEAGRYRDPRTGRFISERIVRSWVDALADNAGERMVGLTRHLQSGALDLADWQVQMAAEIKQLHVAAGLAAHGGRAMASPADHGFIGSQIRAQLAYLRDWSAQIANGAAPLDGRLLARARLYSDAAVTVYEAVRGRDARLRGYQAERWRLAVADHCAGCPTQAGKGWVSIGSLPAIGSQPCRARCRCSKQFRREAAA
jgi:hypothetical protein